MIGLPQLPEVARQTTERNYLVSHRRPYFTPTEIVISRIYTSQFVCGRRLTLPHQLQDEYHLMILVMYPSPFIHRAACHRQHPRLSAKPATDTGWSPSPVGLPCGARPQSLFDRGREQATTRWRRRADWGHLGAARGGAHWNPVRCFSGPGGALPRGHLLGPAQAPRTESAGSHLPSESCPLSPAHGVLPIESCPWSPASLPRTRTFAEDLTLQCS